jgi:hypothetical protein
MNDDRPSQFDKIQQYTNSTSNGKSDDNTQAHKHSNITHGDSAYTSHRSFNEVKLIGNSAIQ